MLKKFILKPLIIFLFNKWKKHFVLCPYINNEAKYMAKGIKPFSQLWDSEKFLNDYVFPKFTPLVKQGIVLEKKQTMIIKNVHKKNIKTIKVHYYYPGEEWRIKKLNNMDKNLQNYTKSFSIREGLLFGYPKKYIRRHILSGKIRKWLNKKDLLN